MLGEKLGEEHGRVTSRRILEGDDYRYVKIEINFDSEVTLLGMKASNMGTYTIFERIPGQIFGEGRGILMTETGQGAIWQGHGIGTATGDGMGMKFAASIAFQAPTEGPLARLNNVLVVVEHAAEGNGDVHSTLYEWKA